MCRRMAVLAAMEVAGPRGMPLRAWTHSGGTCASAHQVCAQIASLWLHKGLKVSS